MTELYNPDAVFFDPRRLNYSRSSQLNVEDDIRFYSRLICEKNKRHIQTVITPMLSCFSNVLEISSGTGMDAKYYVENLPHITWYTSDSFQYLEDIRESVLASNLSNIKVPIELDVTRKDWPELDVEVIFTANILHILSLKEVSNLFKNVSLKLNKWGSFVVYGSFITNTNSSSRSTDQLNRWLKNNDSSSGIKHLDTIVELAKVNDMQLIREYAMPENDCILHFVKMEL